MTCQSCKHMKSGPLTMHGFNSCKLGSTYEFYPLRHSCQRYAKETPELLAKRLEWLKSRVLIDADPGH